MKKYKVLGLSLVLVVFAAMSLGSGSSTPSQTETVRVESDSDSSEDTKASDESGDAKADTKADSKKDEISYEITDTGFEYYENSIGSIEYYGYVEVTNTGDSNLYLYKAVFDLEDNDGHLLQSDDYVSNAPSVLRPGEKGYFYNGVGSNLIDSGVSLDNGVNLVPQITVKKATGEPDRYEITDTELREDSFGYPKLTGRVVNNTDSDCGYLYINVIYYDANGKVLAITGTSVTDLNAGGKVSFECSSMFANDNATLSNIADYMVIAEDTYIQF